MYRIINKQSGVALITAMIISGIAISLAGIVMYRQQIHIRLSSNISHLEQSYLYAKGMEDWAGTILEKIYKEHKDYDSLEDDWAVVLPPIPIPGGVMNGQLFDLQARINLNSIARPKPKKIPQGGKQGGNIPHQPTNGAGGQQEANGANQAQTKPDIAKITKKQLVDLISQLDPDQEMGPPQNFVDILSDWIDKDQETRDFGAESDYYQSREPAYFSADSLLVSPTELRLLKGMDTEESKKIYNKLLKHIATLPIKEGKTPIDTPININTASLEVLKAIGFDQGSAEKIQKQIKERPFRNHKEFEDYLNNNSEVTKPEKFDENLEIKNLSVKSSFFLLKGEVKINNARLFINSILERKNGKVSVIMRDFRNP